MLLIGKQRELNCLHFSEQTKLRKNKYLPHVHSAAGRQMWDSDPSILKCILYFIFDTCFIQFLKVYPGHEFLVLNKKQQGEKSG
jgi:hypothetical protein